MSANTMGSRGHPCLGDARNSKKQKMVRDADHYRASSEYSTANSNALAAKPRELGGSAPHVPIDVDAIEDDVVVSSPTAFAQARSKPRRNREKAAVIDVESGVSADEERMLAECLSSLSGAIAAEEQMRNIAPSNHNKRRIPSGHMVIDPRLSFMAGGSCPHDTRVQKVKPPPPPPPPKEPAFSCPICMGSIDDAMSTKCGHIFCNACLKAAIAAQKKCPTCRAKITSMRSTLRVYLPATR